VPSAHVVPKRTRDPKALRTEEALAAFFDVDLSTALSAHLAGVEASVLELYRSVLRDVPAYARFSSAHGIDPATVTDLSAFRKVPRTTKESYCRAFQLAELCRFGTLSGADFTAVSSGSTGEPQVWPRALADEIGTAYRFEQVLNDSFGARERRTLGVVCFALGSWVGGMFTASACRLVAAKGYPLTLVTPGNNKAEILRSLRAMGTEFEQVVLFGYPPFLKDVIDAAIAEGLDLARYGLGLVTAGEVFSEEWRTLVCTRAGIANPTRTASLYGTADGGVLANETPLSVTIRRSLAARPALARELFGEARLPTLCQYDPVHRYFECEDGALLFTGDGGVPLVRYDILDRGGVVPYAEMLAFLGRNGLDPRGELERRKVTVRELPFVFVFGRSSFAVSFYGANVYPENVAVGVQQPELAEQVTGKFVMEVLEDENGNSTLEIAVELAADVNGDATLAAELATTIRAHLERQNSEFSSYVPPERRTPGIRLLPLGEPRYFPAGVKHRYTR
jgi:phenylacetate-CoA ligase